MPTASWAKRRPARLERVGSKASWEAIDRLEKRAAWAEVTMAPMPTPARTVMSRVHTVERTETSFVHSAPSTPRNR